MVQFWLCLSSLFVCYFCLILSDVSAPVKGEIFLFFHFFLPLINSNWPFWTRHCRNEACGQYHLIFNTYFHHTLFFDPSVNLLQFYCVACSGNLSPTCCVWSLFGVVLRATLLFPIKICQMQLGSNIDIEALSSPKCMYIVGWGITMNSIILALF